LIDDSEWDENIFLQRRLFKLSVERRKLGKRIRVMDWPSKMAGKGGDVERAGGRSPLLLVVASGRGGRKYSRSFISSREEINHTRAEKGGKGNASSQIEGLQN